ADPALRQELARLLERGDLLLAPLLQILAVVVAGVERHVELVGPPVGIVGVRALGRAHAAEREGDETAFARDDVRGADARVVEPLAREHRDQDLLRHGCAHLVIGGPPRRAAYGMASETTIARIKPATMNSHPWCASI